MCRKKLSKKFMPTAITRSRSGHWLSSRPTLFRVEWFLTGLSATGIEENRFFHGK